MGLLYFSILLIKWIKFMLINLIFLVGFVFVESLVEEDKEEK